MIKDLVENLISEKLVLTEADDDFSEYDAIVDAAQAENNETANVNRDWKKEIDTATRQQDDQAQALIWRDYFAATYGEDNIEAVNNLGKAVRIECLYLGFAEQLNPFITFIKKLIETKVIDSANSVSYNVIHNSYEAQSYSNGYISTKDLTCANDSEFGKDNLIFNKALYSKQPKEIETYLALQKKLKDSKLNFAENKPHGAENKIDYLNKVFLNGNSLNDIEAIRIALQDDHITSGKEESKNYANLSDEEVNRLAQEILNKHVAPANAILYLVAKFGTVPGFKPDEALKVVEGKISKDDFDIKSSAKNMLDLEKTVFSKSNMSAAVLNALIKVLSDKVK